MKLIWHKLVFSKYKDFRMVLFPSLNHHDLSAHCLPTHSHCCLKRLTSVLSAIYLSYPVRTMKKFCGNWPYVHYSLLTTVIISRYLSASCSLQISGYYNHWGDMNEPYSTVHSEPRLALARRSGKFFTIRIITESRIHSRKKHWSHLIRSRFAHSCSHVPLQLDKTVTITFWRTSVPTTNPSWQGVLRTRSRNSAHRYSLQICDL